MTAVYGVRETLAALKELDPTLRKEAARSIRTAAQPMARAIEQHLPTSAPTRGMDHNGRTGWGQADRKVKIVMPGRKRRNSDEWALVSLKLVSAPVSIFDMAGKLGRSNLSTRLSWFGAPSRAGWTTEAQLRSSTEKAILEAIAEASKKVNAKLVTKGSVL